jgi:signal transduction histidine kinase
VSEASEGQQGLTTITAESQTTAVYQQTDWDTDSLLTSFIRAVSHDLRSPLLTLSLSTEILEGTNLDATAEAQARGWLKNGLAELERMIAAVSAVSAARSRVLDAQVLALGELLHGHIVLSEDEGLGQAVLQLDARCVLETFAAVAGDAPANVRLEIGEHVAHLSLALPATIEATRETPLAALFASLQDYAGTPAVTLAAAQIQLERQGGAMRWADGRLHLDVPLAGAVRP